jgi:hypothetical protein
MLAVIPAVASATEAFVIVFSDSTSPTRLAWKADLTATKAILICGGIGLRAPKHALIIRGSERIAIPLDAVLRCKERDLKLIPGDILDLRPPPAPNF